LQSQTRKGDYFFIASSNGGTDMRTTILAYVIAFLALAMIGGGVWGLFDLSRQRARVNVPLRYYGMAIGMICGGFGMGGIAQGLRLLVAIAYAIQQH
jgi:hypothetical protein